jgi:hypothetical protein
MRRRLAAGLVLVMVVTAAARVSAAGPTLQAVAGWQRYVEAVEQRRAGEPMTADRFFALDILDNGGSSWRSLVRDRHIIERGAPATAQGRTVEVPSALVNHWVGAVFVPRISLDELLSALLARPPAQIDVIDSAVLARRDMSMKVFLRLRRTKFVTVVYDTEHEVQFVRLDATHAASTSVATKIVQVADAGTPRERPLASGDDDGYLWRLNAYWRYQQVAGGVIAECESLTLSRSVPFGLRTLASRIIATTARESMDAALGAVGKTGSGL